VKKRLAKIGRGILAVAVSSSVVKAERSLISQYVTGALLAAGASFGTVELVAKIIGG
jgi:hypothetical protein